MSKVRLQHIQNRSSRIVSDGVASRAMEANGGQWRPMEANGPR